MLEMEDDKAKIVKTDESETKKSLKMLQRVTTFVTTISSKHLDSQQISSQTIISARYLLSIFFIDKVAWAVGKMLHFDAIKLAEESGRNSYEVLVLQLIFEILETAFEFVISTITPFLYKCIHGRKHPLNSRGLANFALKAYFISNLVALICYPILSVYVWNYNHKSTQTLIIAVALRTFQYSILNQMGDTSLKLSKPHWLNTFTGLSFITPGIESNCALQAKCNSDTLSAHITFVGLMWQPILFIPYLLTYENDQPRIIATTILSGINTLISLLYLCQIDFISAGIDNKRVEEEENSTAVTPIWKLKGYEISIIMVKVVIMTVLMQSMSSIKLVVLLTLPTFVNVAFAGSAPFFAFAYLYYKVKKQRSEHSHVHSEIGNDKNLYQKRLYLWKRLIFMISISIGLSSVFLLQTAYTGTVITLLAVLSLIPGLVSQQMFDIDFDAFLMDYEKENEETVTAMQYYVQVLSVLINGPLLAINILSLSAFGNSDDESESESTQYQAARILVIACVIFLLLSIYYLVFDRFIVPENISIYKNFNIKSEYQRGKAEDQEGKADDPKNSTGKDNDPNSNGHQEKNVVNTPI